MPGQSRHCQWRKQMIFTSIVNDCSHDRTPDRVSRNRKSHRTKDCRKRITGNYNQNILFEEKAFPRGDSSHQLELFPEAGISKDSPNLTAHLAPAQSARCPGCGRSGFLIDDSPFRSLSRYPQCGYFSRPKTRKCALIDGAGGGAR